MQDERSDQTEGQGNWTAPEAPPAGAPQPQYGAAQAYGAPAAEAQQAWGVLFWIGVIGGLLLPILGLVIGIVLLVKKQTRAALIVFAASAVGMAIGVALLSA